MKLADTTGNYKFQFDTALQAVAPKQDTLGEQVKQALVSLQSIEKTLDQLETTLFGSNQPKADLTCTPPYSSIEGNVYELRTLGTRVDYLAASILNRI